MFLYFKRTSSEALWSRLSSLSESIVFCLLAGGVPVGDELKADGFDVDGSGLDSSVADGFLGVLLRDVLPDVLRDCPLEFCVPVKH